MIRFLHREVEFLRARRPYTQQKVALAAHVSQSQASRWHEVPGYNAWILAQLQPAAVRLYERGKIAVGARLLLTGDAKDLETFGRVLGLLAPEGTPGGPVQFVINNLIPRPEPLPVTATETVPAALPGHAGMPPAVEIPNV